MKKRNLKLKPKEIRPEKCNQNQASRKKVFGAFQYYLAQEIGIEFKACLYFFCILFYYSTYRVIGGRYEASIWHMLEMILCTYAMGYFQVLVLDNFDEADSFRWKECLYSILCSGIYTGVAIWCDWFDKKLLVAGGFFLYIEFAYLCAFLVYKVKRKVDSRKLNEELRAFQERRMTNEKCD